MDKPRPHLTLVTETSTALSALEIEKYPGVNHYTGSMADLIKAGVATQEIFPKLPKLLAENFSFDIPENQRWKVRRVKGGRFIVTRWHELRDPYPHKCTPEGFKKFLLDRLNPLLDDVALETQRSYAIKGFGQSHFRLSKEGVETIDSALMSVIYTILADPLETGHRR